MNIELYKKMKYSFTASERYEELNSLCISQLSDDPDSILDAAISCFLMPLDHFATEYLEQAAEAGNVEAMYRFGMCARYGKVMEPDTDLSIKWLMHAAQSGDITSQLEAAAHYESSLPLNDIDYSSAFAFYTMASLAGEGMAYLKLAEFYEHGLGVNKNPQEAFSLCKKAAESGNSLALCTLGRYYENGYGTEKDTEQAKLCYTAAANNKNIEAQVAMHKLTGSDALSKTASLFAEAEKRAYSQLCEQYGEQIVKSAYTNALNDDPLSLLICGILKDSTKHYYIHSQEQAFKYFSRAATMGNPTALWYVGNYYMTGRYVMRNPNEAFNLFSRSANMDYAPAYWSLGVCYEFGFGTEKDTEKALFLYKKAADMGYTPAKCTLAIIYETGVLAEPDYELAKELYSQTDNERSIAIPWAELKYYFKNVDTLTDTVQKYRIYRFEELRTLDSSKFFGVYNRLSDAGSPFSMYRLGAIFENGTSKSSKLPEKAFAYYKKAAQAGYAPAEKELDRFVADFPMIVANYYEELGTDEAVKRAADIYTSSAKSGNVSAMYKLAAIYRNNTSSLHDPSEAYKWSCRLRALGANDYSEYNWHHITYPNDIKEDDLKEYFTSNSNKPSAIYSLGICYETGFGVEKNPQRAAALYYDAVKKGYVNAHYAMARCYESGFGIEENKQAAYEQYLLALLYNDELAIRHFSKTINELIYSTNKSLPAVQCIMGICFEYGYGVDPDMVTAYSYYEKASSSEYPYGIYLFGRCFEHGIGTTPNINRAFELYAHAAKSGCPAATTALAHCFECGYGVSQSVEKALTLYKAAADTGYCDAIFKLGLCILHIDTEKAIPYLQTAVDSEHAEAQYALASYYDSCGDKEKALPLYERSYSNGNVYAEYALGSYYLRCNDDAMIKNGYALLYHAARRGNAMAQLEVAECFARGISVQKSPSDAVKWYARSANAGNPMAAYSLGSCYERGFGTDADLEKAAYYYSFAADQGHPDAQYALGSCYAKGKGTKQNMSMAVYWYRKSVESGNDRAQTALGICYENGQGGLPVDIKTAMELYHLSAAQGNYIAQYRLGLCYERGRYIPTDPELAFEWYEKSASAGNPIAQFTLGKCYENGFGVDKSMKKAIELYRLAAENKYAEAAHRLGICYEHGYGVEQSASYAQSWYKKAQSLGFRSTDRPAKTKRH